MTPGFSQLPSNLPVPLDDGLCDHLLGKNLPDVVLNSTSGKQVNISDIKSQAVFYFYPMTGQPGVKLPDGWDAIRECKGMYSTVM